MADHSKAPEREWAGPCATIACPAEGIYAIRRGSAWANFCRDCWLRVNRQEIHAEWEAAGSPSQAESRAHQKRIEKSPRPDTGEIWREIARDLEAGTYPRHAAWIAGQMAEDAIPRLGRAALRSREPGEDWEEEGL